MIQFKENTVYHAKTFEEAKWLLMQASIQGYKWIGGEDYTSKYNWSHHKNKTCYDITKGQYCEKDFYKGAYKIVEVSTLMEEENIKRYTSFDKILEKFTKN